MTDEQALLAAIRENPDDDTPRLAYADWLDERGGKADRARAEFIRVQCELAGLDRTSPDPAVLERVEALTAREQKLHPSQYVAWQKAFIGKGGPREGKGIIFQLRRGFPDVVVSLDIDDLISNGEAMFRFAPFTGVEVSGLTDATLPRLLACPWLARVRAISLGWPSGTRNRPDLLDALARCPQLANLRELELTNTCPTPAAADRLASANPFPALRALRLSQVPVGAALAPLLAGCAARLEELSFSKCRIGNAELDALAGCRTLTNLRRLSVVHERLPRTGVGVLGRAAFWPALRAVEFGGAELGRAVVKLLATHPGGLREVDLCGNGIPGDGFEEFASSPAFSTVTHLDVSHNPIGDAGVTAIALSPHAANLRRLDVGHCGIGPRGAKALAESPNLPNLRRLSMAFNRIGPEGGRAIAESTLVKRLEALTTAALRGEPQKLLRRRFGNRLTMFEGG